MQESFTFEYESGGETERWLPVAGYEGFYEVSSLGRVWSVPRICGWKREGGVFLTPTLSNGYLTVLFCRDRTRKRFSVHTLVLTAFRGACPHGMVARHGPNGKLDNRASELRWGTYAENNGLDRVRDGTDIRGEANNKAKLTASIVADIRASYASGQGGTTYDLAEAFGVRQSTIWNIIARRTWRHVGTPEDNLGPGPVRDHSSSRGERNTNSKLTVDIVREIRVRGAAGEFGTTLAREFGVSQASIWRIVRRKTWRHVT